MKKGFTLIELLAVIVILAIIAVIAVPIVLNIIDETKSNATLRSADFYLDAVEYTISDAYLNHGGLTDGGYPITQDGNLCKTALPCSEEDILKVEVNGEVPTSGKISITNGNISSIELNYKDGKTIVKNSLNELVYKESILCTANTTKATVPFWRGDNDPSLDESYDWEEVGLLASVDGAYTTGVSYTCNFIDDSEENNMTFFVLSSTENEVTLILGSNLIDKVAWLTNDDYELAGGEVTNEMLNDGDICQEGGYCLNNEKGPITASTALSDRTSGWDKLTEEQKSTIKLPTKVQIESAYEGIIPKWLYRENDLDAFKDGGGNVTGYWTSTPSDSGSYSSYNAWSVDFDGSVYCSYVFQDSVAGVRPVITLSKSNIG